MESDPVYIPRIVIALPFLVLIGLVRLIWWLVRDEESWPLAICVLLLGSIPLALVTLMVGSLLQASRGEVLPVLVGMLLILVASLLLPGLLALLRLVAVRLGLRSQPEPVRFRWDLSMAHSSAPAADPAVHPADQGAAPTDLGDVGRR